MDGISLGHLHLYGFATWMRPSISPGNCPEYPLCCGRERTQASPCPELVSLLLEDSPSPFQERIFLSGNPTISPGHVSLYPSERELRFYNLHPQFREIVSEDLFQVHGLGVG